MMSDRFFVLFFIAALLAGSIAAAPARAFASEADSSLSKCRQVSIRAELELHGRSYRQFGVGSVYAKSQFDSQLFVVTPAHVVSGATRVFAHCDDQVFELSVLGRSLTADVAIGTLSAAARARLEPAFLTTELSSAPAKIEFRADQTQNSKAQISVTNFGRERSPAHLPVYALITYKQTFMNPIFGDHGALLASSGVIPGMSGSALTVNGAFAGMVTKTLLGDSMSAIVPASEIASLLPSLERGVDPYEENSLNPALLTESLVPTADGRLVRWHSLKLRRPALEFKSACHSGAFAETSQWQENRGWGEGGGDALSGKPSGRALSKLPFTLLYGVDLEWEKTKAPGAPTRYASVSIAHRSDCEREGVILTDGRRLVGLMNYPDPDLRAEQTLVVASVDDLLPLARRLGSRLPELIERFGVFADDPKTPLSALCATHPFLQALALAHVESEEIAIRHAPSSAVREETTVTYVESLDPVWDRIDLLIRPGLNSLLQEEKEFAAEQARKAAARKQPTGWSNVTIPFRSGLVCEDSGALHLKHLRKESPLRADLEIFSDHLTGWVEVGQCRVEISGLKKDHWHARIHDAKVDLQLEVGVTLSKRGFFRLSPNAIDSSCWNGTRFADVSSSQSRTAPKINRFYFGGIIWHVN
jgi:hypothetical protein